MSYSKNLSYNCKDLFDVIVHEEISPLVPTYTFRSFTPRWNPSPDLRGNYSFPESI